MYSPDSKHLVYMQRFFKRMYICADGKQLSAVGLWRAAGYPAIRFAKDGKAIASGRRSPRDAWVGPGGRRSRAVGVVTLAPMP